MRPVLILLAMAIGAGCSGSGPTAPSPPITTESSTSPAVPLPTSVTFTVRSGAEGLPVVPGATIHTAGTSPRTTDAQGSASIDNVAMPAIYTVDAPGFLSYRGIVSSAREVVTLWPWQPGMTDRWIALTSYYGPDYNSVLWRPDRDVRLELQGVLELEPHRSVWENAVREVSGAIDSAGTGGPTVRLTSGSGSGSGSVPVRLNEQPTCEVARWSLTPPILTPPPFVSISSERRARDPEAVLDMVAQLIGFNIAASRREGPPHSGGTLSSIERTAIRMRMLRPPGTTFVSWSLEDATAGAAEGVDGYWCR
jgi:hypothetical protein